MTQIITTPDGVEHEFSDNASDAVIKKALQSYSGQNAPKPDVTGGVYTYDKGDGWAAALHNLAVKLNNATRVASDATTYGGLDAAQSLLPGAPSAKDLRAQTNASRTDLGPYTAAAVDAAGRAANPLSWVGGSGPLSLAASGAAQQAASAALHGEDPVEAAAAGGLTGGSLGVFGRLMRPGVIPNVLHHVGKPVVTGIGATYGGAPGAIVAQAAMNAIKPPAALGPVAAWAPKLFQGLNPPVQGALSGYLASRPD